jgi:hypothetical protein
MAKLTYPVPSSHMDSISSAGTNGALQSISILSHQGFSLASLASFLFLMRKVLRIVAPYSPYLYVHDTKYCKSRYKTNG